LPGLRFLASTGPCCSTFLAGAELQPAVMRRKWKEVSLVGAIGFLAPFLGCAAIARFALGWSSQSSWLAGIALSTTSMAVVYSVMLETGFNRTDFGKGILGACFVNDLGTVLVLGLMFAPFTWRTAVFAVACLAAFVLLPAVTPHLMNHLRQPHCRVSHQMGAVHSVRPRRARAVVGQRGSSAGVHRRDGAGVNPWYRSRFRTPPSNTHHRLPDAYLLSARRLVRVGARTIVGSPGLPGVVRREGCQQDLRPLPGDRGLSPRAQRNAGTTP